MVTQEENTVAVGRLLAPSGSFSWFRSLFFLLLESVPGKRFAIFVLDKNIESKVFFNRDARKFLAKRVNAVLGNEGAEFSFRIDVFRGGRH